MQSQITEYTGKKVFRDTRLTIGVMTELYSDSIFRDLWVGVNDSAKQHDVNLLCIPSSIRDPFSPFTLQMAMFERFVQIGRLDGLIIVPEWLKAFIPPDEVQRFYTRFRTIPMVSIMTPIAGIPSVLVDFESSIRAMLAHFIEAHGARRIALIRGPGASLPNQVRNRVYADVLASSGVPFRPELVCDGDYTKATGREAVRLLVEERQVAFDAIVAANDEIAIGAIEALQARGIQVPDDVIIGGFDDVSEARVVTPPLTTGRHPYYQLGYRASEILLSQIAGEAAPSEVILPMNLIIRQSCGCMQPAIIEASTESFSFSTRSPTPDNHVITAIQRVSELPEGLSTARRAQVITRIRSGVSDARSQEVDPRWPECVLDAFLAAVSATRQEPETASSDPFLHVFQDILRQVIAGGGDAAAWQGALSALRGSLLPILRGDVVARAENLWQQARVMLGEMAQRHQAHLALQIQQQEQVLRQIGHRLITTFEIETLMDVLAEELPTLGIPSLYIALFENILNPLDGAKVCLAYNEHGRIDVTSGEWRFASGQLIPEPLWPQTRRYHFVMEHLYFNEQQIGLAVFEAGVLDSGIYEKLKREISNALQGALLVQQVQEHAAEVVRQHYILDSFMANVPDSIYFKDRDSRFIRANQSLASLLRVNSQVDLIGKTDFDFFPHEQAQQKFEQEQEIMRTGQPIIAVEEPDPGGRWALTTKMPLRDEQGNIIGTFGISHDITARKRAERELLQYRDHLEHLVHERTAELSRMNSQLYEEILERCRFADALQRSEGQYRLLAENVKDGIVIVQNGQLVFANQIFAAMTGQVQEHLGMTEPVQLFHPDDRELVQAHLRVETEAAQDTLWQARLLAQQGKSCWIEIEQSPIVWNSQPGLLLTIRNINDRKLREERLEKERSRLEKEYVSLRSTIKERYRFGALVGKSAAMQRVYDLIVSAANSEVNVLICGESGTGKELIAHTYHQVSRRKTKPFVPVNCASIPETLFENEFFGHCKGAFTSAERNKPGLFDRAHGGILFLDEVTELSPGTQAKLLRVLQDGEYIPLGSAMHKQADVVIVAATNKVCQQEIAQGRLREDFFYRIGVIEIHSPPLRERKDDLPLLIGHLLEKFQQKQSKILGDVLQDLPLDHMLLPGEFIQALYAYPWPGNIRELQNVLQRYLVTRDLKSVLPLLGVAGQSRSVSPLKEDSEVMTLPEAVEALEKAMIRDALQRYRYHKTNSAKILGVSLRALHYKIKKYQLE